MGKTEYSCNSPMLRVAVFGLLACSVLSAQVRIGSGEPTTEGTLAATAPSFPQVPGSPANFMQTGSQNTFFQPMTGVQNPGLPPSYVTGMPQPYPMASPNTMGHVYGGYGFPVHPFYRAMHAMIGAPPPPLIPYGAPFYPPYQ
eukprot:c1703_g1_i1.p2 GENE.c1703_g1_i1~~c1703_g1_i1.p2  ORF type:complete len:143 (-),score=15.51 c1703_g1_i1:39-467(-)